MDSGSTVSMEGRVLEPGRAAPPDGVCCAVEVAFVDTGKPSLTPLGRPAPVGEVVELALLLELPNRKAGVLVAPLFGVLELPLLAVTPRDGCALGVLFIAMRLERSGIDGDAAPLGVAVALWKPIAVAFGVGGVGLGGVAGATVVLERPVPLGDVATGAAEGLAGRALEASTMLLAGVLDAVPWKDAKPFDGVRCGLETRCGFVLTVLPGRGLADDCPVLLALEEIEAREPAFEVEPPLYRVGALEP
jgi:hypothetical protein